MSSLFSVLPALSRMGLAQRGQGVPQSVPVPAFSGGPHRVTSVRTE
jgi:hypothetical protein